jgi:hypothetical protein
MAAVHQLLEDGLDRGLVVRLRGGDQAVLCGDGHDGRPVGHAGKPGVGQAHEHQAHGGPIAQCVLLDAAAGDLYDLAVPFVLSCWVDDPGRDPVGVLHAPLPVPDASGGGRSAIDADLAAAADAAARLAAAHRDDAVMGRP